MSDGNADQYVLQMIVAKPLPGTTIFLSSGAPRARARMWPLCAVRTRLILMSDARLEMLVRAITIKGRSCLCSLLLGQEVRLTCRGGSCVGESIVDGAALPAEQPCVPGVCYVGRGESASSPSTYGGPLPCPEPCLRVRLGHHL